MDYPTCLVVCSKPNGADFKAFNTQLSNIFATQFNYDFIDAIYEPSPKYFPEDIDMTKKYDIIWFAGCNMLSWVFGSDSSSIENKYLELEHFEKILTILKDDCMSSLSDLQPSTRGKIIFTEKGKNNQIFINSNYDVEMQLTLQTALV